MDLIFKALADPTRRKILEVLRRSDGQTLTQLINRFELSRFGVMKHLTLLEDAGLLTSDKRGRFKHHYLNASPLQDVVAGWMVPLTGSAASGTPDLAVGRDDTVRDIFQTIYIAAPRMAVWDAITSATAQSSYSYMTDRVTRDGKTLIYYRAATPLLRVTETARDDGWLLRADFQPAWAPNLSATQIVYQLGDDGEHTRLAFEHQGLDPDHAEIADGWARILAGLKTFVETGQAIKFRASPR